MTQSQPAALAKISWRDSATGELNEFVLLEGATATIGRSAGNNICVPERHVSRQHAVIHYRDGIFMISDLGSANGTFVNDQRLTDPFPLAGGDVIRLFVPELTFSAAVSEADQQAASTHGTLIVPVGTGGRPHLSVTSGPQEGMEIDLTGDTMTIGRATANAAWEISLQDRAVSRPHARLEPVPDAETETWRIVDLGSANGTLVNGAPVDGEAGHILRDGDVMTIGETMLLFRMD